MTRLILASTSDTRKQILENAGLSFDVMPPLVDEEAAKARLEDKALPPRDLADALAEAKATAISEAHPTALVIGADQILAVENGLLLSKPDSPETARTQLGELSGKGHRLFSAVVVAAAGVAVWRHVGVVKMLVRPLSQTFIESYVDRNWDEIRHCVGCYRIEGEGAQLFRRIEGDHFDIMGLPLLPLLGFLRERRVVPS